MNEQVSTVVIGGGVAGLALTRCLVGRGVEVLTLDENEQIGHSWRTRYDSLKLNSVRWLSHMPGLSLPKRYGRWVRRDDLVEYVEAYAKPLKPLLRNGVRVLKVERGSRWLVTTSEGAIEARHVVFATGLYREPAIPSWPGEFHGRLIHAAHYTRPADFEGERVVVVGPGVSGVDIGSDLLQRTRGSLTVAMRSAPNFLPRELWNIPLQGLSVTNRYAPIAVQDLGGKLIQRVASGDLADTPFGRPTEGMFSRLRRTGVNPAVDDGVFVPAVRAGLIEVIDEVVALDSDGVVTKSGKHVPADTVIAATGYRTGLAEIIGEPGVLDARDIPPQYGAANKRWAAAGLHFVGFASPLTGHLREIGLRAKHTAKAIAANP
ncbi:Predicted flavoprotein CzcO associated with the cation diffusion facilitator CzcD [Amycolatopsis xylanica]|uniref:Predicted flavoprotein CzcO associated with the cation diffusion facilitator CzcD n=1 Tax=Amycolatopsis xylanica TaxID=589385 RepID=A0A1H3PFL6_9PSEU|nr:NAD(P)/FAD-dependent oxidoreductase [Amycolatopsis xylanica]SDY99880.1 Predicted flavoprotein CzcO associated with the cation diffusion facilitator CzcD [Amycolatopsis xylanica]